MKLITCIIFHTELSVAIDRTYIDFLSLHLQHQGKKHLNAC